MIGHDKNCHQWTMSCWAREEYSGISLNPYYTYLINRLDGQTHYNSKPLNPNKNLQISFHVFIGLTGCVKHWRPQIKARRESTISFGPMVFRISLAIGNDELLIACYINIVCVTVWMPQKVILKWSHKLPTEVPNSNSPVSECQEQLVLIKKDKCRWSHEFRSVYFSKLGIQYL